LGHPIGAPIRTLLNAVIIEDSKNAGLTTIRSVALFELSPWASTMWSEFALRYANFLMFYS
jgi:hypothetical protein